jgi:hypothetical protein
MTNESNILVTQINGPNLVTGELSIVTPARVRAMQSASCADAVIRGISPSVTVHM